MTNLEHKRNLVMLNPEVRSPLASDFEQGLRARIIGQERAMSSLASLYQVFQAGMTNPTRPIGTMLLLGPTGSGKTRLVEAAAETLFGDPQAVIKIDCAEFQHSHEIARLVGSPPGYLGHRETSPLLTQANLDKHQTESNKLTFVLFDEIEKASDALWQLLLGILDKATLTLGDNRRVDFSRCLIFLTSNLGAREMGELVTGSVGFAPSRAASLADQELEQKLYHTAVEAARRKFSPEFMNRIDKVVVFRSLQREQLCRILDLELNAVQRRIDQGTGAGFTFRLTDEAKAFLLAEGTDYRYGARHLKRAVERFLVHPLANLLASRQVQAGDLLEVNFDEQRGRLAFCRELAAASAVEAVPAVAQAKGQTARLAA